MKEATPTGRAATFEGRGSAFDAETQAPAPSKLAAHPSVQTGGAGKSEPADGPARAPTRTLWREWSGPLTNELAMVSAHSGSVPPRLLGQTVTRSICGYCATGCSLDIHLKDNTAVHLSPTAEYPVNLGMACPKGWEALTPLNAPDRATSPLLRGTDGILREVSWDEAMRHFVARFQTLLGRHGPESVAFLSTGQMCTEEMALLGAVFKFGMGGLHGDSNTRQCMATSHVAYKQSFGFDAPPYTYADFESSDVLVFIGSNLCISHPILWQRVLRNPHHPEILVVDPRRTETAMNATQHLAIRPKSDLTLLYGVAHLLIEAGGVDRAYIERHTTGFEEFAAFTKPFTPERVATETGLSIPQLRRFAECIHHGRRVSFWWTMGVNQGHEATRTAQAIINLALMTGNLGRPGTGANSITGQCNAMGSRLYGNTTSLLGGRDFPNPQHRAEVSEVLGIPTERIPAQNSLAYDEILEGAAAGKVKGLWIIATNTAHSWIDQTRAREVLRRLEFLVVQDLYTTTESAALAHLLLPAAGWGEKTGTLINSERRLGLVQKVARAPGIALSDFNIFRLVAEHWGCGDLFRDWSSPEAVFNILKRLSAGRPCDITGIDDYQHLDRAGGVQWPCSNPLAKSSDPSSAASNKITAEEESNTLAGDPPRERRLFADGQFFTPDGRARFIFEPPRPPPELPDEAFPLVLLTGRGTSAQWHTNTRTGKSAVLRTLYPANPYVEIHPVDASRLGIRPQQSVVVVSRRGRAECTAFVSATVQPGQVFMPMHYDCVNRLTRAVFDPYSRQPSYKHCAVRVEPGPSLEMLRARPKTS